MVGASRWMGRVVQTRGDLIADGSVAVAGDVLPEKSNSQSLLANNLPFIRFDFAADQAQECALSFPVSAEKAKPLPALDLQVDMIQQARASQGQADVSQAQ
jgi:hypothetical protein